MEDVEEGQKMDQRQQGWKDILDSWGKIYLGESSRSVYTRAYGYYTDLRRKARTGQETSMMVGSS